MNQANPLNRSPMLRAFAPEVLTLFAAALASIAILLPPAWYESLLNEPNRIFLNGEAAIFVFLCISGFLAGLAFTRFVATSTPTRAGESTFVGGQATAFLLSNVVLTIVSVGALWQVLNRFSIVQFMLVISLEETSRVLGTTNVSTLLHSGLLMVPIWGAASTLGTMWVQARLPQGSRLRRLLLISGLLIGVMSLCLFLLTLKRGPVAGFVFAVTLVHFRTKAARGGLDLRTILVVGLFLVCLGGLYFGYVQVSRNLELERSVGRNVQAAFTGYYVGAFNRLAAIVDGDLSLGSTGGYYWTRSFWDLGPANAIVDLRGLAADMFGQLPLSGAKSRTWAINDAGLLRNFTAVTAYGMSFTDFGWLGFLPFVLYGIVVGLIWRRFLRGSLVGILLYPQLAWGIVEWRGYLEVAREGMLALLVYVLLITVVCRIRLRLPSRSGLG